MPTGEGYDLCEGCNSKFHSEPSAIRDALSKNKDTEGADLYLWGHWWCCKDCWDSMISAGIKNVYLLDGSEKLFNKKSSENIIGHQFDK
jgi:deoxycytidylate deaminase